MSFTPRSQENAKQISKDAEVDFGVFLPISGRAAGPEALTNAARQAERLGFATVWSADRVVTPWEIRTPYPYHEGGQFIVPPDRPFLDSMSCLAYLTGRTRHPSPARTQLLCGEGRDQPRRSDRGRRRFLTLGDGTASPCRRALRWSRRSAITMPRA